MQGGNALPIELSNAQRRFESGVSPLHYRKAKKPLLSCAFCGVGFRPCHLLFCVFRNSSHLPILEAVFHNYRNRETLNADNARTHLNEHELDTNEKCMTAIRDRIPEKRRKDAVLCIEHLITASPEWDGWGTEKETEFFEKSKKWLEEKYGKNNVVSTTIHRDETTPHLVAYVVPLDEESGRLNAKKIYRWISSDTLKNAD